MTSVLDNAKAHFNAKLSEDMQCIEVPEWGDASGPAKIFYKAAINLREQSQIVSLAQDGGKTDDALALSLVIRARNEDGSKMFLKSNMLELKTFCDPEVIARVVTEMQGEELTDEELEKN